MTTLRPENGLFVSCAGISLDGHRRMVYIVRKARTDAGKAGGWEMTLLELLAFSAEIISLGISVSNVICINIKTKERFVL